MSSYHLFTALRFEWSIIHTHPRLFVFLGHKQNVASLGYIALPDSVVLSCQFQIRVECPSLRDRKILEAFLCFVGLFVTKAHMS